MEPTDPSAAPPRKRVVIFTDGACHGNPGPGAWACVLRYGSHVRRLTGTAAFTTNNRMEMMAALSGLKALKFPCQVDLHTDSQYLQLGITKWIRQWRRRGWKTAENQPVKNRDLWEELDLNLSRHRVQWHWVRGHNGNPDNELCDRLARNKVRKLRKKMDRLNLENERPGPQRTGAGLAGIPSARPEGPGAEPSRNGDSRSSKPNRRRRRRPKGGGKKKSVSGPPR